MFIWLTECVNLRDLLFVAYIAVFRVCFKSVNCTEFLEEWRHANYIDIDCLTADQIWVLILKLECDRDYVEMILDWETEIAHLDLRRRIKMSHKPVNPWNVQLRAIHKLCNSWGGKCLGGALKKRF